MIKYKLSTCGQVIIDQGVTPDFALESTGLFVKQYPAKVARGAHKPRGARRGDAPTNMTSASRTGSVCETSNHEAIRRFAARGWK